MARRQKEWAQRKRAQLMLSLGGHCCACGSTESLCFDCIEPKGDAHHRGPADARVMFYTKQMRSGNIAILCHDCNSIKGNLPCSSWWTALSQLHVHRRLLRGECPPGQVDASMSINLRAKLRMLASEQRQLLGDTEDI